MTSKSNQLRAVFLTALMIGSVFAAGIAFTGGAAAEAATVSGSVTPTETGADNTDSYDVSVNLTDVNTNDTTTDAQVNVTFASEFDLSSASITSEAVNSSSTNVASNINTSANRVEITWDDSGGVNSEDLEVSFTLDQVNAPSSGGDYDISAVADADADGTYTSSAVIGTVSVDGSAPAFRKATHYDDADEGAIIEVAFDEDVVVNSSSAAEVGFSDGTTTTIGNSDISFTNGHLAINTSDTIYNNVQNVSLTDIADANGNVVTSDDLNVRFAAATVDTTSNGATFEGFTGSLVAIEGDESNSFDIVGPNTDLTRGAGTNSQVYVLDTENFDAGDYNITNRDTTDEVTLELSNLGLDVSVDSASVTTDDDVTATVTSDTIDRDITFELVNSDDETVATEDGFIDSDGSDSVNFGTQDAGNYTVVVTDDNTAVTAESGQVEVTEAAAASTSFVASEDTTRGDVGTIEVSLTGTSTATIVLGSESAGYQANVTVVDDDGDGSVTVSINTYTMGGNTGAAASSGFYVADDSGDYVDSVSIATDTLSSPIADGSYRTTVRAGGNAGSQAEDVSRFAINSADGITDQKVWTAPGSTDVADILGAVSEDDTIANGDYVVHQFSGNGVFGVLQNASATDDTQAVLNAVDNGELSLSVDQTAASTRQNRDAKALNYTKALDNGDASVVVDAENETFYVVADLAAVDASPRDLEFGNDVYNATLTLSADNTGLTSADTSASAEFSAAERSETLEQDEYTVEAATNQSITIDTNAADGTEYNVLIESQTSPGEGYIYPSNAATAADGMATATVDFSDAAVNSTFSVVLEDANGNTLDSATGEVVEAQQQTTTAPTTTAPTTTAPTTTEETTTVETTTEPTTTEPTTEETTEQMETTEEQMDTTTEEDESGGGIPGFGMGIALLAIIGAAFLALRQN